MHTLKVGPSPIEWMTSGEAMDDMVFIDITFTATDVLSMAEAHGIDPDTAIERAQEWGRHIEGTMSGYCSEQLESAVRTNQP